MLKVSFQTCGSAWSMKNLGRRSLWSAVMSSEQAGARAKLAVWIALNKHINHQGEDPPALCKRVAQFPREDGRGRRGKGLCWHPVSTRNKLPWSGNSSQNQAAIVCVVQRHLQPGQVVVSMLVLQGFSHIFATQPAISDLEISHQPSLRYLCPDQAFPALPCWGGPTEDNIVPLLLPSWLCTSAPALCTKAISYHF